MLKQAAPACGFEVHAMQSVVADGVRVSSTAVREALKDGEMERAQRLLGRREKAVLLFDEMEDLIGDASPSAGGDWFSRREGSKVFVNRLLEANPVPVIWTTNAIGNVDAAILRRMSFVLRLDLPSRAAAAAMLDRVIDLSNDVGLLTEEFHVPTRRAIGNVPQALTHLGVVNTGLFLTRPVVQRADLGRRLGRLATVRITTDPTTRRRGLYSALHRPCSSS